MTRSTLPTFRSKPLVSMVLTFIVTFLRYPEMLIGPQSNRVACEYQNDHSGMLAKKRTNLLVLHFSIAGARRGLRKDHWCGIRSDSANWAY